MCEKKPRTSSKPRDRAAVQRLRLEGKTLQEIADEIGLSSRQRVHRLLNTPQPPPDYRRGPRSLNDEDRARAVRLYEAGATLAEVADTLGCSCGPVRSAVVEAGVMIRSVGRRRNTQ